MSGCPGAHVAANINVCPFTDNIHISRNAVGDDESRDLVFRMSHLEMVIFHRYPQSRATEGVRRVNINLGVPSEQLRYSDRIASSGGSNQQCFLRRLVSLKTEHENLTIKAGEGCFWKCLNFKNCRNVCTPTGHVSKFCTFKFRTSL